MKPSSLIPPNFGSWRVRRLFLFSVSLFCMAVVGYCLWQDKDTRTAESAVAMAFYSLMMITGSYVFGATWEDISTRKTLADKLPDKPKEEDPPCGLNSD